MGGIRRLELMTVSGKEYAATETCMEIENLKMQRDNIAINTVKKSGYALMDKIIPGASVVIGLADTYIENGMKIETEDLLTAQSKFPFQDYVEVYDNSEGAKFIHGHINEALDVYFEYGKLSGEIEEKQKYLHTLEFSQGINMKFTLLDEEGKNIEGTDKIIQTGEGVILPQASQNLARWEAEGIGVYLKDIGMNKEEMNDAIVVLKEINVGSLEWEIMINGGVIENISPDIISKYIVEMQSKLEEEFDKKYDIGEWLREGVSNEK